MKSNNPNLPARVYEIPNYADRTRQARRLAVMRTPATVIGDMTMLPDADIERILSEQKERRGKRIQDLVARGAAACIEMIVDLQMESEEASRELEGHKQYDPLMAIRLQQVERSNQAHILEKVLLPRFEAAEDEDDDPAAEMDARDAEVEAQWSNPDAEDVSFEIEEDEAEVE